MTRTDWFALLRFGWSGCDNIGVNVRHVRPILRRATDAELAAMMTVGERDALGALPDTLTVYRGCGEINRRGLFWSLDRDIAARFPTLMRYRPRGDAPLVTGTTSKRRAVLKLNRGEAEIISTTVVVTDTTVLSDAQVTA